MLFYELKTVKMLKNQLKNHNIKLFVYIPDASELNCFMILKHSRKTYIKKYISMRSLLADAAALVRSPENIDNFKQEKNNLKKNNVRAAEIYRAYISSASGDQARRAAEALIKWGYNAAVIHLVE